MKPLTQSKPTKNPKTKHPFLLKNDALTFNILGLTTQTLFY
jgi:hypothetical protein